MSTDDGGGAGGREVAYRVFAAEYEDADFSYSESDEDRAPNYVVLPTGARVNRVFVVGVLTEVEDASEDILRARVVDPTGAFVVYAGQYQPEATAFLDRADPPTFVAVTGKARTFQPDDSEVTYTSIRPENINEVDAETRDRWTVQCAEQTIDRVGTMARALTDDERGDELRRRLESEAVDVGLASGIPLAIDHYGTTASYLDAVDTFATQAAEVVAGERDEVDQLRADPDETGPVDAAALAADAATEGASAVATETTAETDATAAEAGESADSAAASDAGTATDSEAPVETETTSDADTAAETEADSESASPAETAPSDTASTDAVDSKSVADSAGPESATSFDETDSSGGDVSGDELEDFEPGEFELDEDEREEIEEEYGTDFQTGTEVDEPGEADIDAPTPDEDAAEPGAGVETAPDEDASATTEATADEEQTSAHETGDDATATDEATSDDGTTAEPADEGTAETPPPETEDVDLDDAVMEAMRDHDEGDGASEGDIVAAVTDTHGVAADDVREAIQDALMDGRCYEPEDDVYKPI